MRQEIVDYLQKTQRPRFYDSGEIIFSQGEMAREFYYLISGLSLTCTVFEDSRERNILISWPDRIFGASTFFEKVHRRASAIAIRPCQAICIDERLYKECCRLFPDFYEIILSEVSKDVGTLFDELADASMINSDLRVARFLRRRLANNQHEIENGVPFLPYTQEFIASALGISRVSVNQAISVLASKGWLETSYGKIRILDPKSIRAYAYG